MYPGSSDGASNECFTVTPAQPTISTNALVGPVNPGDAISDTATLSGTATQPDGTDAGGTITFSAYGPDDADCSDTPAFTSTVSVSGDNTYDSGDYTETVPGTYRWVATYSGDSPNTLDVSGACGDANEDSTVNQEQPTLSTEQSWVPQDSATIESPSNAAVKGTIHFALFASADCGELGGDLAVYSENVVIDGASGTVGTTANDGVPTADDGDEGYTATASGDYSWLVSSTSGLASQADIGESCVETSSLTIDNGTS